jgi:hypothetical protein
MQDVYIGTKDDIGPASEIVEDESGCWICGGFTNAGGVQKTWSCYCCCNNSVTETETTRSYKSCYFIPPFAVSSRESEYDKKTRLYTKNMVDACCCTPFNRYSEMNGRSDTCCGPLCMNEKLKNAYLKENICCIPGLLHFYSLKAGRDKNQAVEYDKCSCSMFHCKSLSNRGEKLVETLNCWSPVNVYCKKTEGGETKTKSLCGILPFVCMRKNDKEQEIFGSVGITSCCCRDDYVTKKSNHCITCLCCLGYCKRGRCCKLKEADGCKNLPRYLKWLRYCDSSEYESIGTVDMDATSKSVTCFGVGNCEIVNFAPAQHNMNEVPIPSTATKKVYVRTLCHVGKHYY